MEIGLALEALGEQEVSASIVLSRELVGLLSAQLYQSPVKAIEELVVNSYDADAKHCFIHLGTDRIIVLDDGIGMDAAGMQDLWHVGHSSKRDAVVEAARARRQIGKFGIGKLATAAIANRVTYVTKDRGSAEDQVLTASVDYEEFEAGPSGGEPVPLKVVRVTVDDVLGQPGLREDLEAAGLRDSNSLRSTGDGWTLVILEALKRDETTNWLARLKWVLATAMPLASDFELHLDGDRIVSSKQQAERVVAFGVHELLPSRLLNLTRLNDEETTASIESGIISPTFFNGIRGAAFVTRQTLYGNKSDDLSRSHGFFIRVRGRLVNLDDPLFGLKPSSHSILNRFYCELEADDLDEVLTAPRESVELSNSRRRFINVLNEIFNQARSSYEQWEKAHKNAAGEPDGKTDKSRENERNYVNPRLVERPLADALLTAAERANREGAEQYRDTTTSVGVDGASVIAQPHASDSQKVARSGWYYLSLPDDFDLSQLTKSLYSDTRDDSYRYERINLGRTEPMVRFNVLDSIFQINLDHDLVRAHDENAAAQKLLEDVVTAEALLEVYLREQNLDPQHIEELLSRRDELLRSLTKDRVYSLSAIAADLRAAADSELDLEIQLVVAARGLGFLARHIGGGSEPDGIARLKDTNGEIKITLEAKSSSKVNAGLAAIGFDALGQHVKDHQASGCLLVAPGYPGGSRGEAAAAAKRANEAKVSCWTVTQLARVVEEAHLRHFTATKILAIVHTKFAPEDVAAAIDDLFVDRGYKDRDFYKALLSVLRGLEGSMRGTARTTDIILARVTLDPQFKEVEKDEVGRALRDLAGASGGAMYVDSTESGRVVVYTSVDELERRVSSLLGHPGRPRHAGLFTSGEAEPTVN